MESLSPIKNFPTDRKNPTDKNLLKKSVGLFLSVGEKILFH
jgi:hypothetical protein